MTDPRVCEHGNLRRVCLICELQDHVAELEEEIALCKMRHGAEVAELIADLFNRMTTDQKNSVPPDKAEAIGDYMFNAGYRLVFCRWYKQTDKR